MDAALRVFCELQYLTTQTRPSRSKGTPPAVCTSFPKRQGPPVSDKQRRVHDLLLLLLLRKVLVFLYALEAENPFWFGGFRVRGFELAGLYMRLDMHMLFNATLLPLSSLLLHVVRFRGKGCDTICRVQACATSTTNVSRLRAWARVHCLWCLRLAEPR